MHITHRSDCALHNAPTMPAGECDCGIFGDVEDLQGQAHLLADKIGLTEASHVLMLEELVMRAFVIGNGGTVDEEE